MENDRILEINIENEMKSSYIDYSMSVIVSRALPDVRDGFKPVHRRVLYGMDKLRNNTIPTAIRRFTLPWSAWLRNGLCAIRWLMARVTSVR